MNSSFSDRAVLRADVQCASRAGPLAWMIAAGWIVFPFAVQTVLHPADAVWAQYDLQGLGLAAVFHVAASGCGRDRGSVRPRRPGHVADGLHGAVLPPRAVERGGSHHADARPLGLLGVRHPGNSVWFVALTLAGDLNFVGYFVGFSSVALTVGAERLCQRLGRDFVLGLALSGQHPPQTQPW